MRNALRTILFLSAYSPVLLTLAYVRWDMYGFRTDVWQCIIVGCIGSSIPLMIIKLIAKTGESFAFTAKK